MNVRACLLAAAWMAACLACFGATADQVYKWVDKDGKVHYSSTPPAATADHPEKINVQPAQGFAMPAPATIPAQSQSRYVRPRQSAEDKAREDAADKQIRDTWGNFKKSLGECQGLGQQLDDLKNGVSSNLTNEQRAARERALEAQLQNDCPDGGG